MHEQMLRNERYGGCSHARADAAQWEVWRAQPSTKSFIPTAGSGDEPSNVKSRFPNSDQTTPHGLSNGLHTITRMELVGNILNLPFDRNLAPKELIGNITGCCPI